MVDALFPGESVRGFEDEEEARHESANFPALVLRLVREHLRRVALGRVDRANRLIAAKERDDQALKKYVMDETVALMAPVSGQRRDMAVLRPVVYESVATMFTATTHAPQLGDPRVMLPELIVTEHETARQKLDLLRLYLALRVCVERRLVVRSENDLRTAVQVGGRLRLVARIILQRLNILQSLKQNSSAASLMAECNSLLDTLDEQLQTVAGAAAKSNSSPLARAAVAWLRELPSMPTDVPDDVASEIYSWIVPPEVELSALPESTGSGSAADDAMDLTSREKI